ncbi:hypothetical protein [Pseudalkalibacillus hwajinpoensis]|uniref:Uncharacterized protein n=1 Tax=Guptibacillus hwajinpoensis TaxID=208199 RepID=A0A4U1MH53_9BACL|nr:hypothetical protein [Pseudalkalibacillus hwajinpoensis]TKD69774.1 hypothetical protein FBF83_10830 [Pseudalkalibacillus hwajinpoensis]
MFLKLIVGIIFLIISVFIAVSLNLVSSFFEQFILSKLNTKIRYYFLLILSILFELSFVSLLSYKSNWTFIDSWFTGSILLIALIWLPNYFRPFYENSSRTVGKFNGGITSGKVKVFKFNLVHPFLLGTIIFCSVGIIVSVLNYLPYLI